MRRQTILLAAALAVTTPTTALTESGTGAREVAFAIQHRDSASAPDRMILKIEGAKTAASSIAPVDEASLLFDLAEAHKLREVEASAPDAVQRLDLQTSARAPWGEGATTSPPTAAAGSAESTTPETAGFTTHHGVSSVHEMPRDRERVTLNLAPVTVPSRREGDWETLPLDDTVDGADVSGVAVGLSFKLN